MSRILGAFLFVLLPLTAFAGGLDGRWIGNQGREVVVAGNQWAYYVGGALDDAGVLGYTHEVVQTQSQFTGAVTNYLYSLEGHSLVLQDPTGMRHHYTRQRPPSRASAKGCNTQACFEARFGPIMPNVPGD